MCAHRWAQLLYATQHRRVTIIFPPNLRDPGKNHSSNGVYWRRARGGYVLPAFNCRFVAVNHLAGIYLPLLQPLSSCSRYPVLVAMDGHTGGFLPLATTRPVSPVGAEMVVPLCRCDLEPLEVRCLLDTERPDCLLETYLRVIELPCTRSDGVAVVPAARLFHRVFVQKIHESDHAKNFAQ